MTERSIFLSALEIDDPAARRAYLDAACGGVPDLRRRVDALLAAHADSRSLLDRPAADRSPPDLTSPHAAAEPVSAAAAGTLLAGRYLVGDEVGRGGMGTVYRAEQVAPVRRPVAVKLVNPGMDSRTVLLRFEAERQALAVMDHPHIAKVLDAGATADGRPFFVMELVNGVPLTDYCDARRLTVAERLALFRQVCGAVQHAHQKGVIHRDLKPGNVLVEDHPGGPVPKVIDFGLAKAVGGAPLTEQTLFTAPGAVAGTPLYMAPEQAGGAADVDTRADVYALGAVLYELLTGSPPIGRDTLRKVALHELLRVIREDDPPPPSSRLGSSDALPAVAANRGTEPARLGRFVRGDLDRVAMKALDKDRGRRYESAAALAADVERFLNHEAVAAGPPSRRYRAGKFVRRNRAAVTAAGLVLLVLVGGVIGTTWGLVRAVVAERATARELGLRTDAETAALAEAGKARAERERAVAAAADTKSFSDFLTEKILAAARPKDLVGGKGYDIKLSEALRAAEPDLDQQFVGRPVPEATTRNALGVTWGHLGEYDRAITHLRRAFELRRQTLGGDHPDTLSSGHHLASMYEEKGDYRAAEALLRQVLVDRRRVLGDTHRDTLISTNDLAGLCRELGNLDEAARLYTGVLAELRTAPSADVTLAFSATTNLAGLRSQQGDAEAAERLYDEALASGRRHLGPTHPDTLAVLNNLGNLHLSRRKLAAAEPLLREAVAGRRSVLGATHPDTLATVTNLAAVHLKRGDLQAAEPLLREALEGFRKSRGDTHPNTLAAGNNLAVVYLDTRRFADAVRLFRLSLAGYEGRPERADAVVAIRGHLGLALLGDGKPAEAEPHLLAARAFFAAPNSRMPQRHNRLRVLTKGLQDLCAASGRAEAAARWQTELASLGPEVAPPPRPAP